MSDYEPPYWWRDFFRNWPWVSRKSRNAIEDKYAREIRRNEDYSLRVRREMHGLEKELNALREENKDLLRDMGALRGDHLAKADGTDFALDDQYVLRWSQRHESERERYDEVSMSVQVRNLRNARQDLDIVEFQGLKWLVKSVSYCQDAIGSRDFSKPGFLEPDFNLELEAFAARRTPKRRREVFYDRFE